MTDEEGSRVDFAIFCRRKIFGGLACGYSAVKMMGISTPP
jgi:hypothetical protein